MCGLSQNFTPFGRNSVKDFEGYTVLYTKAS